MPTLSDEALQLRLTVVPTIEALRPEGAVGGLESATLAGTSFELAERLPAPSSACTL